MNRRDILKLLGVGSSVVPIINGLPCTEARALIVTPPVIEVPPPPRVVIAPPNFGESEVVVFIRDKASGGVTRMDCSAFAVNYERQIVDVTRQDLRFREVIPSLASIHMVATGEVRMVEF